MTTALEREYQTALERKRTLNQVVTQPICMTKV